MIFKKKNKLPLFDLNNSISRLLSKCFLFGILIFYGGSSALNIDLSTPYVRYSMIFVMLLIGFGFFFHKIKRLSGKKEKLAFLRIVLMLIAFTAYMVVIGGGQ
ncbi:hypothetical protein [Aliivibrio fischeri]|uniref:hypothetical protein n=1 Tax=Aliivibrio fischeri TaxID=668 RepID=UPI0007C5639E|nr:hypothetical protein [Aliivibrio fischeri]